MYRPSDKKNYLISGIFISALILVISITIFMLNKENPLFSRKLYIHAEVKNAQALKNGAAIQLKGIKVGSVSSIEFQNLDTIRLTMGINLDYAKWIKKDSVATFKTQGVLGDKYVEISGGTEASPIVVNNDVIKIEENSQFEHIITKSEDLMVAASSILTKFDSILSKIEPGHLEKILQNLEALSGNTNKLMSTMNDKNITTSIANFKSSSESMSNITKQIEEGPGTLHALIYDQGLHEDMRALMGGANRNKVLKYFIRETIKKNDQAN
jgi:phospholipid/cholesterol/gamma-HCH transport system substrate-binding protein